MKCWPARARAPWQVAIPLAVVQADRCGSVTARAIAITASGAAAEAWARNWRQVSQIIAVPPVRRPGCGARAGGLAHVGEHEVLQADLAHRPGRVEDRVVGADEQRASAGRCGWPR